MISHGDSMHAASKGPSGHADQSIVCCYLFPIAASDDIDGLTGHTHKWQLSRPDALCHHTCCVLGWTTISYGSLYHVLGSLVHNLALAGWWCIDLHWSGLKLDSVVVILHMRTVLA